MCCPLAKLPEVKIEESGNRKEEGERGRRREGREEREEREER